MAENYDFIVFFRGFPHIIYNMDSHEKLGNLLSQYLTSGGPEKVPENVLKAFHKLNLTEFASRENVDEAYRLKMNQLAMDMNPLNKSSYAREYENQQKKEFDEAYSLITSWLDNKT